MDGERRIRGRPALYAIAAVSWFGVLLELWLSIRPALDSGGTIAAGLLDYFSYFTVLSNLLLAIVVLLILNPGDKFPRGRRGSGMVLGCATTAVLLAGIGYHFLLSDRWEPEGLQWLSEAMQHYVTPMLVVAYWAFFAPTERLPIWAPLAWSAYPTAYFGYVLLRGHALGSYPYYFADVATLGYPTVFINGLELLAAFLLIGVAVYGVGRLRRRAAVERSAGDARRPP